MVKIPAVQNNNIYEVMNNKTCSFVGRNMLNTSANVSLCRAGLNGGLFSETMDFLRQS